MRPKSPDWSRRLPDETPMRNRTAVLHVTLSLGKIGSLIDGLGEYSTQLGHHVAAAAPLWRERWGVRFHFHLPARWIGLFGDEVGYLPVRPWQSRLNLQPRRHAIWHALNQLGRIPPPPGTRHAVMTVHDLNPIYHDAPDAAGRALDQQGPCVMAFGQEGPGLSDAMREVCEVILHITQYGSTRSINAGAAAAIALYEWARQHAGT